MPYHTFYVAISHFFVSLSMNRLSHNSKNQVAKMLKPSCKNVEMEQKKTEENNYDNET